MYEKLPQELKERGAFCLWRYEKRNGDTTKVPYQISGLRGDSTNRFAFMDFASTIRHRDGYDGIGIGVFGDICAIDIDHCVEHGTLSDMAKDIIARMDSYTEYSPSGNGVRILFKAALPAYDREGYYINNRRLGLEVYVAGYTNRFVTVTGNAIRHAVLRRLRREIVSGQGTGMDTRAGAFCLRNLSQDQRRLHLAPDTQCTGGRNPASRTAADHRLCP